MKATAAIMRRFYRGHARPTTSQAGRRAPRRSARRAAEGPVAVALLLGGLRAPGRLAVSPGNDGAVFCTTGQVLPRARRLGVRGRRREERAAMDGRVFRLLPASSSSLRSRARPHPSRSGQRSRVPLCPIACSPVAAAGGLVHTRSVDVRGKSRPGRPAGALPRADAARLVPPVAVGSRHRLLPTTTAVTRTEPDLPVPKC